MKHIESESFKRICDVCNVIESRTGTKASRLEDQVTVLIDKYLASRSEVADLKNKLKHEEEFGAHQLAKRTEAEDKLREVLGEMLQGEPTGGIEVVMAFVRDRAGITGPHLVSVISQLVSKFDAVRDELRICRNALTNEKIQTTDLKDRIKAQRKARELWGQNLISDIFNMTGIPRDEDINRMVSTVCQALQQARTALHSVTATSTDSVLQGKIKELELQKAQQNAHLPTKAYLDIAERITAHTGFKVGTPTDTVQLLIDKYLAGVKKIDKLETQVGELKVQLNSWHLTSGADSLKQTIAIRTGFKGKTPTETVELLIKGYFEVIKEIGEVQARLNESKAKLRESDTAMLRELQRPKRVQELTGVLDRDKLNVVTQIFCAGYNFTPAECLDRAETLMSLCSNPKE